MFNTMIHLDILKASEATLALAAKMEVNHMPEAAQQWMNLAQKIEGLHFTTQRDVTKLVVAYPFLKQYQR